jgi:nicotinamidase-related amidase
VPDALIVVDMQMAFVHGPHAVPGGAELVERIGRTLGHARAAGALVVHLQNDGPDGAPDEPGTAGWEPALPLEPGELEFLVRKAADDGFEGTRLGELLKRYGVDRIVLCGVQSEMCVAATARGALARGLHVLLPHDAHATYDIPAVDGLAELVPAHQVARVAEWSLGDEVEIVAHAADVEFVEATRP